MGEGKRRAVELWLEVQKIVWQAQNQVREKLIELCNHMHAQHGAELEVICGELNCKMYLMVEMANGNPLMIRPLLQVQFMDDGGKWELLLGRIGVWTAHYRVSIIRVSQPPKPEEALYIYPHVQ